MLTAMFNSGLAIRCFCSKKSFTMNKIFTQDDLDQFTKLTGDSNPIHSVQFPADERMVHGALLNGIVSGIIGTELPGPGSIVLSQQFSFPKPCRINKDVKISVRLLDDRKISLIVYKCYQGDKIVFQGKAKILQKPLKNES